MVGILRKSKCLVDLRNNFTIRKAELALSSWRHFIWVTWRVVSGGARPPAALKYLVRFFSSLLNCS